MIYSSHRKSPWCAGLIGALSQDTPTSALTLPQTLRHLSEGVGGRLRRKALSGEVSRLLFYWKRRAVRQRLQIMIIAW